jgi:hypothetical protein
MIARALIVSIAALVLAGCAGTDMPGPPAPFGADSGGGYTELRPEADVVAVSYLGPYWPTSAYPPVREHDSARASAHATDMALWRSVLAALEQGFSGLEVIESEVAVAFDIPSLPRLTYATGSRLKIGAATGLFGPLGRFGDFDHRDRARVRAVVEMTARLVAGGTPGALDAAEVARDLAKKYRFALPNGV